MSENTSKTGVGETVRRLLSKAPTPWERFLQGTYADHERINRETDVARLVPVIEADGATHPSRYLASFSGLQHFVRRADGSVDVSDEIVNAEIRFPPEYLRSSDPNLAFRVVRIKSAVFHPNVASPRAAAASDAAATAAMPPEVFAAGAGGIVCLGYSFRPGTRLRGLIFQLHRIIAGKDYATDSPLDAEASRYFLNHLDRVGGLESPPLWKTRISRRVDRPADGGSAAPEDSGSARPQDGGSGKAQP